MRPVGLVPIKSTLTACTELCVLHKLDFGYKCNDTSHAHIHIVTLRLEKVEGI